MCETVVSKALWARRQSYTLLLTESTRKGPLTEIGIPYIKTLFHSSSESWSGNNEFQSRSECCKRT